MYEKVIDALKPFDNNTFLKQNFSPECYLCCYFDKTEGIKTFS